ncbi:MULTISPECIES: lipid A deacylase LpxR family protein [unclassified Sphingobacterium]|uniref:lipid A deacylase LpxR family protein n=1 Tax=unclassified Sphingobacterium TaxID=2609468 RepID=UPI0025E5B4C3|nr:MULTISPECIES: lipid A deacylase LpxR family protein [unclassified Sphingobacterium]
MSVALRSLLLLYGIIFPFFLVFGQVGLRNQELSLQNDNDVYLLIGQDRYYTNGINVNYRIALPPRSGSEVSNTVLDFELGQRIYNGISIIDYRRQNKKYDRPFAGYLYLSAAGTRFLKSDQVVELKIELGQIGSRSYGEEAQKFIHHLFGMYEATGWETELSNAFGVDLQVKYLNGIYRNQSQSFDLGVMGRGALGMNNTNVEAGIPIRAGRLKPYHASTFTHGHLTQARGKDEQEWYFVYQPSLARVFYNSTITGGLGKDDPIGELYRIEPWMLSHRVGFSWSNHKVNYGINYIFNSKELKSIFHRHQYGQLFFAYRF